MVVGETGDYTGSGCKLANMPAFLPWADSRGVSYLAWTFNPWGYNHDVLIKDWQGTPTACEGEFYSAHLAAVAANPPTIQSPQAIASPPINVAAQPQTAGAVSQRRPRIYFAILLIGMVNFIFGLALAMNVSRKIRRNVPGLMQLIQVRGSLIGILMAMCGAALSLSSLYILLH